MEFQTLHTSRALRHWHPALRASDLRQQPVERMLCGQEIVLFCDSRGQAHALDGRCPHRKMRLALGRVVREAARLIESVYHGWGASSRAQGVPIHAAGISTCVSTEHQLAAQPALVP